MCIARYFPKFSFNNLYVNVAKYICTDLTPDGVTFHPSCQLITFKLPFVSISNRLRKKIVKPLSQNAVLKRPLALMVSQQKNLKSCCRAISKPLSELINYSLANSTFLYRLKLAQVIPVYKKNDPLDKHNYRRLESSLSCPRFTKKSINLQLSAHFENLFNPFLGAFRQGKGCQSTLLRLVEDWHRALDSNEYVAAILMDL